MKRTAKMTVGIAAVCGLLLLHVLLGRYSLIYQFICGISIAKHLTNKRRPIKYAEGTASVDFFNDLESPDIDRRRVGSHFWIACRRMCLTLYKNNWGSEIDYKFREDGFIETIHSIPEDEMPKLMKLCNNAKSEKAIVRYLYDRFSQDGYASYNNILVWLKENNIEYSTYWNV